MGPVLRSDVASLKQTSRTTGWCFFGGVVILFFSGHNSNSGLNQPGV